MLPGKLLPFETGTTLDELKSVIGFEQHSVRLFGKLVPQPRLVRWYGPCAYTYSGLTLDPVTMPPLLETLRERVSEASGTVFNSVMCNLYRSGKDSVGWHSDNEPIFDSSDRITSVSIGAPRRFLMRSKQTFEKHEWSLADGVLLIMAEGTQENWEHSVPKTAKDVGERINLTFRKAQMR